MNAIAAELRRFFRRRSTWVVTLVAVLLALLLGAAQWYAQRPPLPEDQAMMEQLYQQEKANWDQNKESIIQQCLIDEALNRQVDPSYVADCSEAALMPTREMYGHVPPEFFVGWQDMQTMTVPPMAFFLVLIAVATFIGAEFASGNIGTLLTFESRRTRVYLSKLFACVLGSVFIFVVWNIAAAGASALSVLLNQGTFVLPDGYLIDHLLLPLGWTAAAVAGVGLAVGAVTVVLRRTIGVLGLAMGYLIVGESMVPGLVPLVGQYTLYNNVNALIQGEWMYRAMECGINETTHTYDCSTTLFPITRVWAAQELGGLVLFCLIVGWLVFRRRDVT